MLLPELACLFRSVSIAGVCSWIFVYFYLGPLKWVSVFTTCMHCSLSRIAMLHLASSFVRAHDVHGEYIFIQIEFYGYVIRFGKQTRHIASITLRFAFSFSFAFAVSRGHEHAQLNGVHVSMCATQR